MGHNKGLAIAMPNKLARKQSQNNIKNARQGNGQKIKVFNLNIETLKQISDPTGPPKKPNTALKAQNNLKIDQY